MFYSLFSCLKFRLVDPELPFKCGPLGCIIFEYMMEETYIHDIHVII